MLLAILFAVSMGFGLAACVMCFALQTEIFRLYVQLDDQRRTSYEQSDTQMGAGDCSI